MTQEGVNTMVRTCSEVVVQCPEESDYFLTVDGLLVLVVVKKKYLLKNIDAGKADSKALKTLALCWAYRKRAFSVSGSFRQLLSDLIKYLHNSNRRSLQITLLGEIIHEEKLHVIGFVPADVVRLKEAVWFRKLDSEQVRLVDQFLAESGRF